MAERETKTFEAAGHEIVAYTYITGPESEGAQQVLLGDAAMPDNPGQTRMRIPAANSIAFRRALLKSCVVSIDGNTDPMGFLDQLPSDEYDGVLAAVRDNLPRVFLPKASETTPATPSPSSSSSETVAS